MTLVALLLAVADGLGDDFGLVAVDAAGSELLGDGERVEHAGSLTTRAGGGETVSARRIDFRDDFEAKARAQR